MMQLGARPSLAAAGKLPAFSDSRLTALKITDFVGAVSYRTIIVRESCGKKPHLHSAGDRLYVPFSSFVVPQAWYLL